MGDLARPTSLSLDAVDAEALPGKPSPAPFLRAAQLL